MRQHKREDQLGERREHQIQKARSNLNLRKPRVNSARRDIHVPDNLADVHRPLYASSSGSLNTFGAKYRPPSGQLRQRSNLNSDLLLAEATERLRMSATGLRGAG